MRRSRLGRIDRLVRVDFESGRDGLSRRRRTGEDGGGREKDEEGGERGDSHIGRNKGLMRVGLFSSRGVVTPDGERTVEKRAV